MRMLVIDPSIVWPEDAGVAEIRGDFSGEVRVLRPALRGDGPGPGDGYDFDAVVLMGSRASVHDDLPWLADLGRWLDPLLDGSVVRPLLGICFGHQLVAHRAGAEVRRVNADGSEERGVQLTRFAPCRLVPEGGSLRVVTSHGEEVAGAPEGFRGVAARERVGVDALEHDRLPVFTVQFHPEAREEFLRRRGLGPHPEEARAFEDQSRILKRFRTLALQAPERSPQSERSASRSASSRG